MFYLILENKIKIEIIVLCVYWEYNEIIVKLLWLIGIFSDILGMMKIL